VLKADGPGWLVTHVFGHSNHVGGSACLGIYFLSSMLYFILLIFCSWIPESELMMASSNESNNMSAIQALWSRDLIRSTVLLWLVKFAGFFTLNFLFFQLYDF
jgi:ABC-type Na+ efflux pump permease subunit